MTRTSRRTSTRNVSLRRWSRAAIGIGLLAAALSSYAGSATVGAQAGPDIRILPTSLSYPLESNNTIYIELDWMEDGTHSHKPSQAVLDTIVETFAREGFKIVFDVSNAIPHQAVLAIPAGSVSAAPAVQAIKASYFNHSADPRYFYSIWAHDYSYAGGSTGSSGIADLPGNTHLVTMGSFPNQVGAFSHQVGTFIHEFGHNLGQKHGGIDHDNYKPNYLSIMNYLYQLNGIGPAVLALGLANTSTGFNNFGHSHGQLPALNEASLDENVGLGLGKAVDWNCSGTISTGVAQNLQVSNITGCAGGVTPLSTLTDFDNWGQINSFVQAGAFAPTGAGESSGMCITAEEDAPMRGIILQLREQGILPPEESLILQHQAAMPGAAAKFFDVFNDGTATLSVSMGLDSPAPWITWEPASFNVAPGGSQRVYVYANVGLAPAGTSSRRILVTSNDADESPYPNAVLLSVTGNGTAVGSTALFDATLQAPKCSVVDIRCDTGPSLVRGRGAMLRGVELNAPNTIGDSCADGNSGTYFNDESIDRIKVFTNDGTPFAPGKAVTIQVTAYIFDSSDFVDLYYTSNAASPSWTFLGTLSPPAQQQVLTAGYVLPAGSLQAVRARIRYGGAAGACGSGDYDDTDDLVFAVTPPAFVDFAQNGQFTSGATGWQTFALPDASGMTWNTTGSMFQFYRTGTQAVVFQNTGIAFPTGAAVQAQFKLGNSAPVKKRISVLVHDADFTDLSVCTFWLPAGLAPTTYTMRTHTTKPWANATASFYAATVGSTGFYQVDDVTFQYAPSLSALKTECWDATTPAAPGGAVGAEMITNGTFASGLTGWTLFGQINGAVNSGVFEFIRLAGNPAGVILQATGQAVTANQILTATFQLGNSSPVRKRVTVIVHDNDFSDLSACTFWIEPGQALSNYTYRTFATEAWTNATFSVYGATVGSDPYIRLDNVSLKRTPGTSIIGTECLEPGAPDVAGAPFTGSSGSDIAGPSTAASPASASDTVVRDGALDHTDAAPWMPGGFETVGGGAWTATAGTGESKTLEFASDLDLSEATAASLTFTSARTGTGRAEVQVAVDGVWETAALVSGSESPTPVEVDLTSYAGHTIRLRLVLIGGHPADEWRVADLAVTVP